MFELDADVAICPIAIKYNKMFSDPFWNSSRISFAGHLMELMTSWCTVAEVMYLEPQYRYVHSFYPKLNS